MVAGVHHLLSSLPLCGPFGVVPLLAVCITMPPCPQSHLHLPSTLQAVARKAGGGCWVIIVVPALSLPLPSLLLSRSCHWGHCVGGCCLGVVWGPPCVPSAHYPPDEQLLVSVVVGTVSLLSVLVWCGCGWHWQCAPVMHPTSSCSWAWGGCFCSVCHCHCGLGNVVVGVVSVTWRVSRDQVRTLQVPCFTGLPASPCVPPVWCSISVNIPSSMP